MFIFYSYAHDFYFHSNIPTHYPHLHLFYVTMMGFAFLWLALWFAIYITFASKSAIMFHTMRWMCTSSKTFLSHLSGSSPIYLKITHTCVQNLREIHSTRVFFSWTRVRGFHNPFYHRSYWNMCSALPRTFAKQPVLSGALVHYAFNLYKLSHLFLSTSPEKLSIALA